MIIDNFKLIKPLMVYENQFDFYWIQIIRRGKDHPNLPAANRTIKNYFLENGDDLNKYKDEIIKMCELFGARAYFYPQRKNHKDVLLLELSEISQRLYKNNIGKSYTIHAHCAALTSINNIWIVDLDSQDENYIQEIESYIETLAPHDKTKIIAKIPTLHGWHLLTCRFNSMEFQKKYHEIEIHKRNPTILYANDSTFNKTTTC